MSYTIAVLLLDLSISCVDDDGDAVESDEPA
jgi:hypothetical protein